MKRRVFVSGLALLATLVGIGWLLESGVVGELLSERWIDREVRGKGIEGELLFLAVAGVATAAALPRHVVAFLGGYAFGLGQGTALALAGTAIGCVLTFFYARIVGRPLVSARLGARVQSVEDFLAAQPFWMTVLIRLLPIGNNFATNLAAGVSRVPARPFFLGSVLGYLPQTLVFALAGSGVDLGAAWRIGIAVALFVVSGAIGAWLYRKYRHGKTLGAEIDEALDEHPETDSAPR
ncbi:MAG TPA: VTT domain-containing protein [Burkholderiales bacterium]|nr:VTT domain-containing protein [Burkholderiales bacterium]